MRATECGYPATVARPRIDRLSSEAYASVINTSDSSPTGFGVMLINILGALMTITHITSYLSQQDHE